MNKTYRTQEFDSLPYAIFFVNTDSRILADKSNLVGDQFYFDNGSSMWYVIWWETSS